eukprot:NP_508317.1 Uncharacterized protein CELE_F07G6.3 [Caenorhabditis elegans]
MSISDFEKQWKDFEKERKERDKALYKAEIDYKSLKIREGQSLSDYFDNIETVTDAYKNRVSEDLISLAKTQKLMELISYDFWHLAENEKNRVPVLEQFDVLKNWISKMMIKFKKSKDNFYEDQRCFDLDYMMRKENNENKIHVVMSNLQQFSNMSEARAQVMVEYITEWFQDREKVIAERETYIFELLKSNIELSIKSYGIDKEHTENDLEMDKVDQKAKDTYLGPPLNSNILENFQNCESTSIVTIECSKTDYETEHETQIIDSPDAIQKETTAIESITIQEKSCDNENDKIEHITHNSLNNQVQKTGLQKPGDVACGGFFDKKMKRRVNEEMRPRTDPPTDLSQQACYGTVSDTLDWNNWSHENWKDMSWQRFVRESRPRKDPPWSSCRSEVGVCYGWRWDVSQVPSCSQDWRSHHVLFTPRQAAEVQ